ncbi:MAG: tyrosine-protein phosphatase [Chloroflexi bacterium]|nr:tyrosine-protein phosphatase [Chloroflexota bacterium]
MPPKPTLIHCKAGADRTGLAAALFLMSQGTSFDQAAQQLSLKYFHFPWLGSPSVAMDQTLNAYGEVTVPPPGGANIAE